MNVVDRSLISLFLIEERSSVIVVVKSVDGYEKENRSPDDISENGIFISFVISV